MHFRKLARLHMNYNDRIFTEMYVSACGVFMCVCMYFAHIYRFVSKFLGKMLHFVGVGVCCLTVGCSCCWSLTCWTRLYCILDRFCGDTLIKCICAKASPHPFCTKARAYTLMHNGCANIVRHTAALAATNTTVLWHSLRANIAN